MPVILIVDDVVANVRLLKNLLQDVGQVVFAQDGMEALAQAERHRPDIVLLDVMMPGLDGYETCRRLKALPETNDIPVIFITGADAESDEEKGLAAGAIDYITKPFAPAIVRARVQNHLALVRVRAELRKFKAAVDCSSAAIIIADREARIEYVNTAFVQGSGFSAADVLGQTPQMLKRGETSDEIPPALAQAIQDGTPWRGELRNRRKDGTLAWEDVAVAPVYDSSGAVAHFVAINSDITQRKEMESELRRLAVTDPLTGVANRRRLMEVGVLEMLRARRSGQGLCVMMLDIDHFKRINDTFGHPAGDAVIQAMSRVCTETVRTVDTVGRMGGEEFAVVLPETECAGALELADRLRERLEQFAVLRTEGEPIHFTVSIGVAQCVAETPDFAALLGLADQGLYRAKHGGRNRVAVMPQGETQS